jgi:hypothetical protein
MLLKFRFVCLIWLNQFRETERPLVRMDIQMYIIEQLGIPYE